MRSAVFSRSEVMWVENSTVQPASRSVSRVSSTSARLTGSSPLVGSSSSSSSAPWDRARHSRYFSCIPLLSFSGVFRSSSAKRRM